jgi:hypothetical protein
MINDSCPSLVYSEEEPSRRGYVELMIFSYGLDLGFFKSWQPMLKRLYGKGRRIWGEERRVGSWLCDPIGCS